jgi:hypothetical protein
MTALAKKTCEEHRQYLHDIVRLKLWFVWWWQHNHPDESFSSILREKVDIYRKTSINRGTMNPVKTDFENPEWLNLEEQLYGLYQKHGSSGEALLFEDAAFRVVLPTIDARARRDYEERPYVLDYQCGSLKYDKPNEKGPKRIFIHIANAVSPQSIFADKRYLPQCLMDVMEKSAAEYGADSLGTSTWLNSHPRWLELFPSEWLINMEAKSKDVEWHFGFWGQFITARGTFNARLGQQLRETGELPYWPRYSWCSFDSLRQHLGVLLNGTETPSTH